MVLVGLLFLIVAHRSEGRTTDFDSVCHGFDSHCARIYEVGEMKELKQNINILGTEYGVYTDNATCMVDNADGLCRQYDKQILIRTLDKYLGEEDAESVKIVRMKEVCRHEVIHAFFYESGLDDYSDDELLVAWLAAQFPKMLKVFQDMNAI